MEDKELRQKLQWLESDLHDHSNQLRVLTERINTIEGTLITLQYNDVAPPQDSHPIIREFEDLKEEVHGMCHTLMRYGLDI
jgi:chromosome segregation ATPase